MYARTHGCMRSPVGCISACLRACACVVAQAAGAAAQHERTTSRGVSACVHVDVINRGHVCVVPVESMYECARRFHRSVCVCMCGCARGGLGIPLCTLCVCIDACASRHVWVPRCARTHTYRRLHLCLSAAISSCMHVCMDIYVFTLYVTIQIIYYVPICMHAWMQTCVYGPITCTGIDMHVYSGRCHVYRWVHGNPVPSMDRNMYP